MYIDKLRQHYEDYFGVAGNALILNQGPKDKLPQDFHILEFPPNKHHNFWVYCSNGMSIDRLDDNLIELFVFSPRQDNSLIELLTICASYHRNNKPLNLHHTVNIGQPWLDNSPCDHAFISLPYLNGEQLELFSYEKKVYHCFWLIPITNEERDYKIAKGVEALEQLFEDNQFNYIDPNRRSLA